MRYPLIYDEPLIKILCPSCHNFKFVTPRTAIEINAGRKPKKCRSCGCKKRELLKRRKDGRAN